MVNFYPRDYGTFFTIQPSISTLQPNFQKNREEITNATQPIFSAQMNSTSSSSLSTQQEFLHCESFNHMYPNIHSEKLFLSDFLKIYLLSRLIKIVTILDERIPTTKSKMINHQRALFQCRKKFHDTICYIANMSYEIEETNTSLKRFFSFFLKMINKSKDSLNDIKKIKVVERSRIEEMSEIINHLTIVSRDLEKSFTEESNLETIKIKNRSKMNAFFDKNRLSLLIDLITSQRYLIISTIVDESGFQKFLSSMNPSKKIHLSDNYKKFIEGYKIISSNLKTILDVIEELKNIQLKEDHSTRQFVDSDKLHNLTKDLIKQTNDLLENCTAMDRSTDAWTNTIEDHDTAFIILQEFNNKILNFCDYIEDLIFGDNQIYEQTVHLPLSCPSMNEEAIKTFCTSALPGVKRSYYIRNLDLFVEEIKSHIFNLEQHIEEKEVRLLLATFLSNLNFFQNNVDYFGAIVASLFFSVKEEYIHHSQILRKNCTSMNESLNSLKLMLNGKGKTNLKRIEKSLQALEIIFPPPAESALDTSLTPYHLQRFLLSRSSNKNYSDDHLLKFFNDQLESLKKNINLVYHLVDDPKISRWLIQNPELLTKEKYCLLKNSHKHNCSIFKKLHQKIQKTSSFQNFADLLSFTSTFLSFQERYTSLDELLSLLETNEIEKQKIKNVFFDFKHLITIPSIIEWSKDQFLSAKELKNKTKKTNQPKKSIHPPLLLPPSQVYHHPSAPLPITSTLIQEREKHALYIDPLYTILRSIPTTIPPSESINDLPSTIRRADRIKEAIDLISSHYLPLIDEQICFPHRRSAPYLFSETLLTAATLTLEQSLKLTSLILNPLKEHESINSHDLLEFAMSLALPLSDEDIDLLEEAQQLLTITSRHLYDREGKIANLLRIVADGHCNDDQEKKVETICFHLLRLSQETLKKINVPKNPRIINSQLPFPTLDHTVPVENLFTEIEPKTLPFSVKATKLCIDIKRVLPLLEALHRNLPALPFRNCGWQDYHLRQKVIFLHIKDSSYHLAGIQQLLPHFMGSAHFYSQVHFLMGKITLLLEQTLLSMVAFSDIPSNEQPARHILIDKVGRLHRERPRYFDHDIERILSILEQSSAKKLPAISPQEREAITSLKFFLSRDGRYLTRPMQGGVATELLQLRELSHQARILERGGFTTQEQYAELSRRYGENRSLWNKRLTDRCMKLMNETISPTLLHGLRWTQRCLEFSMEERERFLRS